MHKNITCGLGLGEVGATKLPTWPLYMIQIKNLLCTKKLLSFLATSKLLAKYQEYNSNPPITNAISDAAPCLFYYMLVRIKYNRI